MELCTLSVDDVETIHNRLCADFARSPDPIAPPGVKSIGLLESAVNRQHSGSGLVLKYPDCVSNAATLLYGIVCDHPFHNGNKRTGLVAMLVHLDKNKHSLYNTTQPELFNMVLAVANHAIGLPPEHTRRGRAMRRRRRRADDEVAAIVTWLATRTARVRRGEREISFRELKTTLERFGYSFQHPAKNSVDVVRFETVTKGLLRRKQTTVSKRIGSLGYPGEHAIVSMKDLKRIRTMCRLTEEDGVDSDAFYGDSAIIDSFINKYRTILRRLASR